MNDPLDRIADALERLSAPPAPSADPASGSAFRWAGGRLVQLLRFRPLELELLVGIDAQKAVLAENSRRHAAGLPAHDALLWGARGMGKSALAKATVAAHAVPLIEIARDEIGTLPRLFDALAEVPRPFVIFADDLGFETDESRARILRSVLDGGIEPRPDNCRLYVTSNRRHIVPRELLENDPVAPRDSVDDRLALSDRFGLSIGFHSGDQATYLQIVSRYTERFDLPFDAGDAIIWAQLRGARSGRVAWQYVQELAGRHGVNIP